MTGVAFILEAQLPGACWVSGDAARVRQVLHNLLGNAVKFTKQGWIRLHVTRGEHGATVCTVQPYVYAPSADAERVAELFDLMDQGKVDAIVFTSSPQIDRLFEVARERGSYDLLMRGLGKTKIAAVGPIVAENLHKRTLAVDICPEQGFVMKSLVQLIKRALG